MDTMNAIAVQHFLRRAKDFEYSMKLCNDSSLRTQVEFPTTAVSRSNESLQSAALLGIHAAISYADALRTGLGDLELSADDHQKAVGRLKRILVDRKIKDLNGIQRFGTLVSKKSAVAYSKNRTSANDLKWIVENCQLFSTWINRIGKQLQVEGWVNVATEE